MTKCKIRQAFPFWNWLKNQLKDTPVCELEITCTANSNSPEFPSRSVTKRIWKDLKIDKTLGEIKGRITLKVKFDVPAACISVDVKPLSVFGNLIATDKPVQSFYVEAFATTLQQHRLKTTYITYAPNVWHRLVVHYSLSTQNLFNENK